MKNRAQFMLRTLFGIAAAFAIAFSFIAPAAAFDTTAEYAVLMDGDSKAVLWAKEPDVQMHPASMSKLMTISMLFDALKNGSVKLTDTFPVSEHAWRSGGAGTESSTMFAELGSRIPVEDLIQGIVVLSGNDACIIVAEGLAGTEEEFAVKMNERGKELGLLNSHFVNSSGWPDPNHLMTAHDLALLARHIIYDFPEYYHYFKEKEFKWNGITQPNRNLLLYRNSSVDGLKTGHTEASHYGLTASAKRGDTRLILVINGLPSEKARVEEGQRILDWGFRAFKSYKLFAANAVVENAPVWQGDYSQVPLVSAKDVTLVMTPEQRKTMKVSVQYAAPIAAPITAGQKLGTLRIEAENMPLREIPLVSGGNVERLGIFRPCDRRAASFDSGQLSLESGTFITLEGGEGAGKSTQLRLLEKKLVERNKRVLLTREPGGSPGAEIIRDLLVTGDVARWTPLTEALLHFAARKEHLEKTIRPALARGDWVVCDRFVNSTFAYQGVAQGLGADLIMALRRLVIGEDMPKLTLILDLPVEIGLARAKARAGAEDRYERMEPAFHEKLRTAFLDIAKAEPERCVVIDATGSEGDVATRIWSAVTERLAP